MKRHVFQFSVLGVLLAFFIIATPACNLSSNSAAQTVTAAMNQLTETAKAAPTGTNTPAPTATSEPTLPPPPPTQPAGEPLDTVEPAASAPTVTALENTNCRMGADPIYPITGAIIKNMQADILGTNENKGWWLIADPAKAGQNCWVWGQTMQVTGDTSAVPYVPSPPLPDDLAYPYPIPEE